ncbi:MAG: FAD-dependent oxidoreductase [Gammaproteobacteria bacterium]|jgi:glutamate synthase (NADPH/NADH) small chain|nr:FAD-dependent oxidoreductase [Gammaproteobacteria bacterium]
MTDIRPNRLSRDEIARNFSDLHPPLSHSEAIVEADRCYFCFDAPCTTACPTGIDIPGFIQKIRSGNLRGSAHTILSENIMGGMCARVCPTEVLCEEACVRNTHEEKPVEIGLLQRYATDPVLNDHTQLFSRQAASGFRVAVVGGGPAGLSCAHRLAMLGSAVTLFDRDEKLGGLNEYGIAAYKTVDNFAQREVDYILSIGGIEVRTGVTLGKDISISRLRDEFDAVFVGVGLAAVNVLGIEGEDLPGVENAVEYIADLRQATDKGELPVGRRVVVIGGGMTAIDVAVQSKRLGAERVDIVYRRTSDQMGASDFEKNLAQSNGVTIHTLARPLKILGPGHASGVLFERTAAGEDGSISDTGETFTLDADVVFKAIGQQLRDGVLEDGSIRMQNGKIVVDEGQSTSLAGVWAGGDCVVGGDDLTVTAVQHGKVAAIAIDHYLRTREEGYG